MDTPVVKTGAMTVLPAQMFVLVKFNAPKLVICPGVQLTGAECGPDSMQQFWQFCAHPENANHTPSNTPAAFIMNVLMIIFSMARAGYAQPLIDLV
jgi:hypothetical protein